MRQSAPQGQSQVLGQRPAILRVFRDLRFASLQLSRAQKTDRLGDRAVLRQQLDWTGNAAPCEGPVKNIGPELKLMAAVPGFRGQLENRERLQLICVSRKRIEVIAAPALGIDRHVGQPLAVFTGIKIRVANDRVENETRVELVGVRASDGAAP